MKIDLIEFIFTGLISIVLSFIFLIIGLFFLSDSLVEKILKFLKPKVVEKIKNPLRKFINILVNLYINNNLIDLDDGYEKFNTKTEYFLIENKKIDKNIYVIDLCNDMIAMLNYVIPGAVHGDGLDIYEQSMNYLYHYSNLVEDIDQDKNFAINFLDKIRELEESFQTNSGCPTT